MKTSWFRLLPLLLLSASLRAEPPGAGQVCAKVTLPDGFIVSAALAVTPSEHATGLMFIRSLAPDRGMFFVFEEDGYKAFWMKNTYVELDMVFLSRDMRPLKIFHRAPPSYEGQPEQELFRAGASARFVLELAGGTALAHGVKTGSALKVVFPGRRGKVSVPAKPAAKK
jgi:uncharacterized membrane protein (UPF0127 family)